MHQFPAVDGGERAVIFDRFRGVLPETVGEGTHFRIPFIQDPNIMDIRTRAKTISSVTGTKGTRLHELGMRGSRWVGELHQFSATPLADLQMVNMSVRTLAKPDEDRLSWIFTVI
jgi:prohibitin 1